MSPDTRRPLRLAHDLAFADLYTIEGAERLDRSFGAHLRSADPALAARLAAARENPDALDRKVESELLIALGPHLEDFLAALFAIEAEVRALEARHHELAPLYVVKRLFVQRKAMNTHRADVAATFEGPALRRELERALDGPFTEVGFAAAVTRWQQDEVAHAAELDVALRYAAWAAHTADGRAAHRDGVLFRAPRKLDYMKLVPLEQTQVSGIAAWKLAGGHVRRREGFALTDRGMDFPRALDQSHYCIWCHEQGKDSCARGLPEKKPGTAGPVENPYKKSPFGVTLAGCPLEEKISEFHKLRADGWPLAALAIICVDNPLVAGTGHRICNDCMKSCIYQKTDPVDIPQAETRILKDVLALTWGFEVYSLLTRWNPLDLRRPLPRAATGRRALVVGMGPAGFTLVHHLLNDGHTVVGIDGLKIEPLPPTLSGVTAHGERVPFEPVRDAATLSEPLDDRVMAGFGGVAEYGITVRWDKNFLKVIRLLLERRDRFALFGGVRFGGTLDTESAFAQGFDHVAVAAGAGKPTVLELPNGLATGVRTASDFLMALQLTGAAKTNSVANMQLRLPVVVVGGGLTAIDTATEALAYYPVQVEKILSRYEALVAEAGRDAVESAWTAEERSIAEEFLAHARALRDERAAAAREGREARIVELLQGWGGATIAYRRRLVDSPSYTLNHEEVEKALEEGIRFAEGLTPLAVEVDAHGHACALRVSQHHNDGDGVWHEFGQASLPARAILVAAGTQPNTVLAREDAGHFQLDGKYFRLLNEEGRPVHPVKGLAKPEQPAVLTGIRADGRATSFFGDLHPSFHGNVVKAMASARQGYPIVSRMLDRVAPASSEDDARFFDRLNRELRATVVRVDRLTPTIVEVVVRAPTAARRFRAGTVLPATEFRNFGATRRRHPPHNGRAGLDGRVGGSRAGARLDDRAGDGRLVGPLRVAQTRGARGAHGTDRNADRDRGRRDRRSRRRRPRQRRAVLDRRGVPPSGISSALLRRLQANDRPLQGRRDRSRGRRRRLVQRRGTGLHGNAPAGSCRRGQHRRGDDGVRIGCVGRRGDSLFRVRPAHRHWLGPDDGRRRRRAAHRAGALSQAGTSRNRVDQLADAVHDEGDLRAVPAAAQGPRHGQSQLRLLVFQSGSAD